MAWLLHTLVFFIAIQSVASQITVTFGNDFPRINESEPIGTIITTMTVTSIENSFITVTPLQQTGQLINLHQEISTLKYFKANILLNQELDYETYGSIVNLIFTFSTSRTASAKTQTLIVVIIDVNDNKPRFIGAPYAVTVPENEVANTAILTVNATDPDALGAWATLSYSIQTSDPKIRATFEVDNVTGVVELTKDLDYERQTFYELTLAATDGGGLVGTTQMFVTVTDVQDMPPYFTGLPYMKTVLENSPNGSEVITVRAFDGDRGNPNTISYLQLTGACESFFKVDETSGEVTVVETIDRDSGTVEQQTGVCALTIEAREVNGSGFGASANTTVTLTISDEDDNSPLFNTSDCQAKIQENMPNGLPIVFTSPNVLTVQDIDATVIFSTFDLELGGADAAYFEVSPKSVVGSGSVIVRVKNSSFLDYEQRQHARLTVIARGTANPAHQSTSTVSLNITNLNDNSPVFDNNRYKETVEEGSAVDTHVVTVHATDEDLPPYGNVTYNLLGGDGMFKVDRDSGSVTVARVGLDRETKPRYFLTIEASDPDGRKSTTSVIVYLGDRNEAPFFLRDYDGFLKENEYTFSKAIQVQATDNDIGNNAVLRYLVNRTEPTGLESNFTVSKTTGIVSIANPLDYEQLTSDEVILTIEARDLGTPPMSANVNITLTVQDENDEAPKFLQNGQYTANVKEDSRRGAVVFTVDATDGDRSSPNNLTYFVIVSGDKGSFRIDPNTGVITTTGLLDYDRGERRYDIKIQVQDRGSPGKSSNGIVQIDVENVNDENPAFPNGVKTVRIDENQTVSSLVANFSARDVDPDKDLLYTMAVLEAQGEDQKAVDVNTIQDWFRIDGQTGEIAVYSTLDRETAQQVTLEVTVNDTAASFGHTPQTATGTLTVVIQDVDDNYPQFQQQAAQYNAEIVENSQPGQPVNFTMPFEMKITDKDEGVNSEFDLFVVPNDTFVVEPSFVSGSANILINVETNTLLDYEKRQTMNVIVEARERGGNHYTSTAAVTLSILDANDNYPDFGQETASASISEHSFEGDVVILVNASDADSTQYGMGTYELQGGQHLFQIDSATGNITRQTGELNYEVQKQYFMTVIATDLGNLRTTLQLTVNITDYNDETPQFTRDIYEADLKENEISFSRDLKVQAFDGDEPNTKNSKVSYTCSQLQTRLASNFTINSTSGEISVVSALDFEALSTGLIHLIVFAKDQGNPQLTSTATININVQDVNDNRPEFSPSTYTASVQEGSSTGTQVVQVNATDADRSSPNNEVFFLIQRGALDAFTVNSSTGRISVIGIIDRDVKGSYNLVVVAMDRGNPPQSASTTVKVTVEDINNKKPEFVSSSKTIEVNETDGNSTDLYRFSATDADQNSKLSYSITDAFGSDSEQNLINSSYIQNIVIINSTTGVVQTARELDRETISSITLIIQVEDLNNATAGQTATGTLVMTILDVNDNKPTFQATAYTAEIQENMQTGVPLTLTTPKEMTVTDHDAGQNSEFSVSVQGNMSRYFSVTPPDVGGSSSLSVRVKDRSILDYEMRHNLTLTIVAQETKTTERFKDTATITLNILDMNDNSPTFVGDPYHEAVLENQTAPVSVLTVQATDPDSKNYSMGTFSLRGGDDKFVINEDSGTISTASKLDREKQDTYSLIVTAIDKGNRTETAQVTIIVNDVNDERPRFKRTDYSANIEENDNKTTPLLKVEAEDKDKPGTKNSEVRYTISPSSQLAQNFTINDTSGEIYVNGYLDYERLPNKATGVVSLVVVAKDEGSPVLSSSVTVSVIVQDVNDETPAFEKTIYLGNVTENENATSIVTVKATDKDGTPQNSNVFYLIQGTGSDKFRIDGNSGVISSIGPLDWESDHSYTLIAVAMDRGTPAKSGSTTVDITVINVNDVKPTFSSDLMAASVAEGDESRSLYNMTASDPDENALLLYTMLWNETSLTDNDFKTVKAISILQEMVQLNNRTGEIRQIGIIDREIISQITLVVHVVDENAEDNKPQTAKATLMVTILDEDDNSPTFNSQLYTAKIEERSLPLIPISLQNPTNMTVQDIDQDQNSRFALSLVYEDPNNTNTFEVVPLEVMSLATVIIRVKDNTRLDYEKRETINFTVLAKETQVTSPRNSSVLVTLEIEDVNDNVPEFVNSTYETSVFEDLRCCSSFIRVQATDKDSDKYNMGIYKLQGQGLKFDINETTGEIFVAKNETLDRETQDLYTLTVEAVDKGNRTSSTSVTIHIKDVNDNSPEFTRTEYSARIKEQADTFISELTVHATDDDLAGTENANVGYTILSPGTELKSNFSISNSGEITLNGPIDYESLPHPPNIDLLIVATDHGNAPLSANVTVTITVQDVNDNTPYFSRLLYQAEVTENSKTGVFVVNVSATDDDGSAPNNQILYVIDSGAGDNFRIDGKSGNITVQTGARIDRETQAKYSIVILAIDQGTPSKTGTTTLSVNVQDINDEAPTFTTTSSSVSVFENSTETTIYKFSASDPDSNSSLLYEVLWSETVATDEQDQPVHIDPRHWFSLDNIAGNLTSKPRVLDRETAQTVVLKVLVTDLFAQENIGKQTATATLRVTLLDVNDNYPEIQQGSSIDVQVSEGAAVDTVILKLDATDRDEKKKVSFSTDSTAFNITSEGRISLAEKIDREKTPFISLNVYATDDDHHPRALTSTATVNVTVLDINDNDPKFNHTAYSFTIPENSANESFLGIVTANDIDEGPNANVTYFLDGLIMSDRFYLNPLTGELTTEVSLDREERDVYTISVTARDNPLLDSPRFSKATVNVKVTDENDNAPEFTTNYTERIAERFTGGNIVRVSATDADLGENATVWYKLSTLDGNETELFNMSSTTGEVGTVQSLIGKADIYNMIVIATDEGPENLTGETFLTIQVLDENLNKPQFTGGLDILPVPECANVGKTVFTFTATDADKDKLNNGRVRFNISEDTPADTKQHFRLEAETGILSVGQQLNREVKSSYQIRVVAYDHGIPSLSSTTEMLTIQIKDVNDQPPKFEANITKIFSINENTNGNLGKIEATDEDIDSRICYKISDPLTHPNVELEKLNNRSVMLRVVKHFDRESMETLGITVVASDCTSVKIMCGKKFAVNETSTAELTINIKDVNDNPPHFVNPLFRAGIRNKVPIGTPVFRLDTLVTDKDTPPFSRHTFFAVSPLKANKRLEDTLKAGGLGNYNNSIVVSTNGSVTTDKTFTAANGYFSLMVNASDDAGADMCELQIFIIADFQVLKITFYKGRDDLKKLQNSILRTMTNSTGLTFVSNDELAPHIKSDGSADPYQTDMFVHAVDEKGNILNADQSQDVIDNNIDLTNRLIKAYSLIKVEVATVTSTPVTNDDRSQFILVAVVCLLAITLLIIIFISFDRIRRYRRKLKAATIDVKVGPKTQEVMVVNENPIFNKELELRQEQGSETQSVISDESIDDNKVYDNVEPGSDDEQEMTVDFSYETEQRDRGDKYLAAALKQHDMRKMSKGSLDTVSLSSDKEDETKENFVFYTPKEGELEVTEI